MGITRGTVALVSYILMALFLFSTLFVFYSIYNDVVTSPESTDVKSKSHGKKTHRFEYKKSSNSSPNAPCPMAKIVEPLSSAQAVFLEEAKKALQSSDKGFFTKNIMKFDMNVLKGLVEFYMSLEPVKPSNPVKRADSLPKINHGTKTVPLERNPAFLPTHYHRQKARLEIAGRGKNFETKRIAVAPYKSRQRAVAQFGDDCAGASADGNILIIADGVGGSEASYFTSNAAVTIALVYFERHPEADILKVGYGLLQAIIDFLDKVALPGSSTFTIAQIKDNNELSVANVGDSFCTVVDSKKKRVVFQTTPKEYEANKPYQISGQCDPPDFLMDGYKISLQPGDIVYLYSDGTGDNLWPVIVGAISDAGELAAKTVELFTDRLTDDIPFNEKMKRGTKYKGKEDDVSVVLRRI